MIGVGESLNQWVAKPEFKLRGKGYSVWVARPVLDLVNMMPLCVGDGHTLGMLAPGLRSELVSMRFHQQHCIQRRWLPSLYPDRFLHRSVVGNQSPPPTIFRNHHSYLESQCPSWFVVFQWKFRECDLHGPDHKVGHAGVETLGQGLVEYCSIGEAL